MWVDIDDVRAELERLARNEEELAEEEEQYEFLKTLRMGTLLGYTNVEIMLDELEMVYRERESENVSEVRGRKDMKNREKYKNELMDVIKMDGKICGFVKKHGVFQMFGKDVDSFCEMTCVTCGTALQIWLDEEYIEPEVDWDNVPVDTLVRVRDNDNEEWVLQYFKGIDKNRETFKYMAWSYGATSVTAQGNSTHWQYCELVEDENNDK